MMPKKSTSDMELIVTVDESHFSRMEEIAETLRAKGLKDIQTLSGIGAITGRGRCDLVSALRRVSGVAAVETAGTVRIAPPESDIQ
jgi:hypothetical protein